MSDQADAWSGVAGDYEREFIDPYRPGVRNPLRPVLRRVPAASSLTVADLGCGIGPLLPFLSRRFAAVWAVDFAEGMLARARRRCRKLANVQFLQASFTDLAALHGRLDVAVAVNSLVLPDVADLDAGLAQVRACVKPGGRFYGIVPAIDSVHYLTQLLLDRARAQGQPPEAARRHAAHFAEHHFYDFAFGQFRYRGLEQHFWQPWEVRYRLRRAGFARVQLRKVRLDWRQFGVPADLHAAPAPWDWFFAAR
jgi:SAM-dependent methyltransferase